MKIMIRDIFSKQMLIIQKNCSIFIKIYHFNLKEKKKKIEKTISGIEDKEKYVVHMKVLK